MIGTILVLLVIAILLLSVSWKTQDYFFKVVACLFSIVLLAFSIYTIVNAPNTLEKKKFIFDCNAETIKDLKIEHNGKTYNCGRGDILEIQRILCSSERFYQVGRVSTIAKWEFTYADHADKIQTITLVKSEEDIKIFLGSHGIFSPAYSNSKIEEFLDRINYN